MRNDHEYRGTNKQREMEKVVDVDRSSSPKQMIRNTASPQINVGNVIKESDGSLVQDQKRRLKQWENHFRELFS